MVNGVNWQFANILICTITSMGSVALAVYAWRRRRVQGARWFGGLVLAVAWITAWYALEAAGGDDINAYVTFSKFEYIGLTFIPLLWLGFALNFSGRERPLSIPWLLGLAAIPLMTIVLAFTNDWHGLIWSQVAFDRRAFPPIFTAVYGAGFWVYTIYAYLVFLVGSYILVRRALDSWRLYRAQASLIFIGTALPWIANLLEIFDVPLFPGLYLNAILLGLCILSFAFALFRLRLLDIMPLAYDTILNTVPDGLIVVDMQDQILALNHYVKPYLDDSNRDPIGRPLNAAFSRFASDYEALKGLFDFKGERQINDRVIEIRISPVVDRLGHKRGRLFVLRDVTLQARIEQSRREQQLFAETMRDISATMNSTLDTHHVLALIVDSISQFMPYNHANIMLVEADNYTTRIRQHRGYSPETAAFLESMEFDYRNFPVLLQASAASEPTIINDTLRDSRQRVIEGLLDMRSSACAPIRADDTLVGFINVDSVTPGAFKPEIANRLQIFAQQAGIAIKNARLYEQTRHQTAELERRVEALTIAQQVYKDIGFSANINHLLEMALDATLRISFAHAGYVALVENDTLVVGNVFGNYKTDRLASTLTAKAGIVGQVISEHRTVHLLPPTPIVSALDDIKAQIALPMYAYDPDDMEDSTLALYGFIILETKNPERFTEDRVQLLELIMDRVGAALENANLVEAVKLRAAELEDLYERVSNLEHLKSDMIRIAAHDLKNPLSVILNYLVLLTEFPNRSGDIEEMYQAMLRSSRRMLQIVEDFLSLDRIEKVAEQKTMQPFDLREIVTRAKEEFAGSASQKGQHLSLDVSERACIVNGDSVQIYEAITNFVSNAIKYTPEGGKIDLILTRDADNVRLEVRDTGFGIPESMQDRLFEPFYRAKTEETARIEGSGLGLNLVKNIIERHNGSIIFRSVYQQGSTFGFQLPLYHPVDLFADEQTPVENPE